MPDRKLFFIGSLFIICLVNFTAISAVPECPVADLTGDCVVNFSDLVIFADSWLTSDSFLHPGSVARWRFDESAGETAAEDIGGYDGILYGDPQWMPLEGSQKGALFFDGVNDYVRVEDSDGLDFGAADDLTVCCWFKTTYTGSSRLLFKNGPNRNGYALVMLAGKMSLRTWSDWETVYAETDGTYNDGQWHHMTGVRRAGQSLEIYIDGQLQKETAVSGGRDLSNEMPLTIGAEVLNDPDGIFFYHGQIDEVQLYSQALSPDEVLLLYLTGSPQRHIPDFTADDHVDLKDYAYLSTQWKTEAPEIIISEFLASNDAENPPVASQGEIRDGNGDSSDWIELYNQTDFPVDLAGWSLSDKADEPTQWQFPQGTMIEGRRYLILFASGKEQEDYPDNYPYVDPQGYLHTNFKLSASGEYLALRRPDGRVEHAYEAVENPDSGQLGFPEQEEDISYGVLHGDEYYFALPTPGGYNRQSFLGFVEAPEFSHERGYYHRSFLLALTTEIHGAVIRYTTDGTDPTLSNGLTYTSPISITVPSVGTSSRCIRAAAFKPGYETSSIKTKTYLLNAGDVLKGLPAVCLSGSPTQTFFNPDGVMAIVGGTWDGSGVWRKLLSTDYNNVLGHGMDYERPVSMEYINPALGVDFQEDCGLRVHGSAWMRPRYTPPSGGQWAGSNKYSFRLYFRSDYGETVMRHSILEQFPEVDTMDTVVLRAGHNDQSNPFVRDEMIRRLQSYMGHEASLGTFVNLFINGSYKGYYNLCERIDEGFCQKYYDSGDEWDVVGWIQPDNVLEAKDGDMTAFKEFIDYARTNNLADPVHYNEVVKQLDLEGFVDYIIVQCWGGNWDWPQNNWTACAERAPDRKWRFFVWDAEGCMDNDLYRDRFGALNSDSSDLSRLYQALRVNADFRMLFADRLQKHFLESDSVMRQAHLHSLFEQLADEVAGVIPNINQYIPFTYIPGRESVFFNQCVSQGLFTFRGPDLFLNQRKINPSDSGMENSLLTFQDASGQNGDIYFTLNGTDPRLSLSQRLSSSTLVPENAPKRVLIPTGSVSTNWRSNLNFNDSAWNDGLPADSTKTGGVGYEVHSGNEAYISYNVRNAMYNQRTSAYIRIPFTVNPGEMDDWNYLTLSIRYDDAFVAYINGTEVCRRGFSGTPQWNSGASSSHENNGLEIIPINTYLSALRPGDNLLAIHGLNIGTNSSDFIISPILEAGYSDSGIGISPAAQKFTSAVPLQKSVTVKARTLKGSTWSALRQADVSIGHVNEYLRISEVQYHPADPNEEFIELTNIGPVPINLNQVSFSEGIEYTFGDTVLPPDAFLLLVRNPSVFENKYGTGLPVAGQYDGALDNAGETLKLRDAAGFNIQTLDYGDGWYDITDGEGFSLTAVDPFYEKTSLPQTGLTAHWSFDEAGGTAISDTIGQHPGMMINMADTQRALGQEYKALYFNGVTDYVRVEDSDGLDFGAADDLTVCCWFKTTYTGSSRLLFKNGPNRNGYALVMLAGKMSLRTWSDWVAVYAETDGTYNDGQWHHMTGVRRAGQSLQIYIDGQLQKETAVAGGRDLSNDMPLTMGAEVLNDPDGIFFYQGLLDDMRIYERALSESEIASLARDISWSRKALWRPSAIRGGTPGRSETLQEQLPLPGAVVINEMLTHSHAGLPDWVELYNTTGEDISIGGWFISDADGSDANRKKYQIPARVVLTPASPYYVIEEGRFNNISDPGCRVPFALSEGGETLYLQSAQGEELTGYFTKEEFDAAETNVSFGRFEKSTGSWNFVPMSVQTPGAANAYPKVGPVIISEIMYNPGSADGDQDYEYVELMNISTQPVRTAAFVSTYTSPTTHVNEWIPWAFTDGITFTFPVEMELAAGQRILLVKDLAAFNTRYSGVPAGTVVMEWTGGNLANEGEKLQLSMPGDMEYQQDRYYIRQDRVNYDDEGDWPGPADGTGKSLTHLRPDQSNNNYSNDPVNWTASDPSPGW